MFNKSNPLDSQKVLAIPLVVISSLLALAAALVGVIINVVILAIISGIVIFYLAYTNPKYSTIIMMMGAFFLPLVMKVFYLGDVPVGTGIEAVNGLLILILIIRGKFSGWKSWPGILLLIWFGFNFIELFNPNAVSRIAGVFSFRGTITVILAFLVAYSTLESKEDFYFFLKWWLVFGLCAGLYGIYQEYAGLPSYDYDWAAYDENRYNLLFTWGRLRKFSFFNGPTEFGLVMAYTGIAGVIMFFFNRISLSKRICLVIGVAVMFWAMIFSGTRTATILLPLGIMIVAAITLWKRMLIAVAITGVLVGLLLIRPTTSQSLFVMLTAFQGVDDPSMNVRIQNQKAIRGYIQSSPFGYGLGSTGDLGAKHSPDSFVSTFPPDSEFVRIAVEMGWIGLLIWCAILAFLLSYGINAYFSMRDPELKQIMLVPLTIFFMMIIAQYPQECFRTPVLALLFSFMVALIAKLKDLDTRTGQIAVSK